MLVTLINTPFYMDAEPSNLNKCRVPMGVIHELW